MQVLQLQKDAPDYLGQRGKSGQKGAKSETLESQEKTQEMWGHRTHRKLLVLKVTLMKAGSGRSRATASEVSG